MTPEPKVTIILPVYNVEPYLRQCLDSVVNQTMRDIRIICVNDGSTDGSPAILEEYAAKDQRIQIIHQENQGAGSARNAAYPHIRGKYTYFVDPDDWIELDLCQRCWDKAEETESDIVVFRFTAQRAEDYTSPYLSPLFDLTLPEIRQSPEEKYDTIDACTAWQKFWRSDFLLSNDIRFAEGKRPYNDNLMIWKGFVLAKRVSVLNNTLYRCRVRPGSYQQSGDERHYIVVEVNKEKEKWLLEIGQLESYREFFSARRLVDYHYSYSKLLPPLRPKFLELVRQSFSTEDRKFYRTAPKELVSRHLKCFYEMIDGRPGTVATINYHISLLMYKIAQKSPRQIFGWFIKQMQQRLKYSIKK